MKLHSVGSGVLGTVFGATVACVLLTATCSSLRRLARFVNKGNSIMDFKQLSAADLYVYAVTRKATQMLKTFSRPAFKYHLVTGDTKCNPDQRLCMLAAITILNSKHLRTILYSKHCLCTCQCVCMCVCF